MILSITYYKINQFTFSVCVTYILSQLVSALDLSHLQSYLHPTVFFKMAALFKPLLKSIEHLEQGFLHKSTKQQILACKARTCNDCRTPGLKTVNRFLESRTVVLALASSLYIKNKARNMSQERLWTIPHVAKQIWYCFSSMLLLVVLLCFNWLVLVG